MINHVRHLEESFLAGQTLYLLFEAIPAFLVGTDYEVFLIAEQLMKLCVDHLLILVLLCFDGGTDIIHINIKRWICCLLQRCVDDSLIYCTLLIRLLLLDEVVELVATE